MARRSILPPFSTLAACLVGLGIPLTAQTAGPEKAPANKPAGSKAAPIPPEWSSYRGGPGLPGVASGALADRMKLAWRFKTDGAILSSPVVAGATVYFGSSDQSIYAVNLTTGKKRWAFKTDDMIDAPPLVLDGRVFIGSADFFFYALDAKTGALRWKFETGDKILGSANYARMADGSTRILVGSYDGKLYCVDAETGKLHWTYGTDNYINGTPAVAGDRIVFGGCDSILHVVSVKTGKALKKQELGQDCHVAGSVALADNHAYFGHYGNAFVSIDLANPAKAEWVYTSPRHAFFSSPAILPDRVVFGGRDKFVHCADRKTGKKLWTFKTRRKVDGSPVACGNRVVVGSGDGRLYMLDLKTGKKVWEYEIGRPVFSSPAVAHGMIFVGANDDYLYAFRAAGDPPKRPAKNDG